MNFEVRYQYLPPYFKTEHSFPKLSGMLADDGLQRFAFWELSLGEKASHPHSCFILKSWLHSMAEQWRATKAHNFPLFGGKLYRDILAPGLFFKDYRGFYFKWTTVQSFPLFNSSLFIPCCVHCGDTYQKLLPYKSLPQSLFPWIMT